MFSQLQHFSGKTFDKERREMLKQAAEHVKFVNKLYRIQLQQGRTFLHEHPAGATSWYMKEIQELMKDREVVATTADQCMYGLEKWSTKQGD